MGEEDNWLEEEMARNGMDKKTVNVGAAKVTFKSPLGVPEDYKPPVSADKPFVSDHPFFDMEDPQECQSDSELYAAPTRLLSPEEGNYNPRAGKERRDAEELTAKLVNVFSTMEALNKHLPPGDDAASLTKANRDGRDMVVLPHHYARFAIEPIRFAVENNLNFLQSNIIKYVLRFDAKNGNEDLDKAMRYLVMLKRWVNKDPDWWKP